MIHDVDESIKALIRRDAMNGSEVDVLFDAPTKEWASRRNNPTVDVYLYDIREDLRRRSVGQVDVLGDDGLVTARQSPPRHFRLSYLVTAWTQRPEDEHRLLSAVLTCFVSLHSLPREILSGWLREQPLPVLVQIAHPPPEDRSLSDVWSALGGELKPSLDLVVCTPVPARRLEPAAPPVLEEPRFTLVRPDTSDADAPGAGRRRRGGRVPKGQESTIGRGDMPSGPVAEELPDETVRSGRQDRPGRIIRVRGMPRP